MRKKCFKFDVQHSEEAMGSKPVDLRENVIIGDWRSNEGADSQLTE